MRPIPIQAVIFDIGMVLLKFDFNRTLARLKGRCLTPPAEMERIFWGTGLIQPYEVGRVSTRDFALGTSRALGFEGTPGEFIEAWSDIFTPNTPMIDRARSWKSQGVPIYYLSNTCESHVDFFTKRYDVLGMFDGGVYSHLEGCAKPDAAIYRAILERYRLGAGKTLFLDDRPENVEAAQKLGIHAIQYGDETCMTKDLKAYDVTAP